MKLTCAQCSHNLEIDDTRVPAGRSFKVKCTKCGGLITGKGPEKQESATAGPPQAMKAPVATPAPAEMPIDWERIKPFVEAYVNQKIAALKADLETTQEAPPEREAAKPAEEKSSDLPLRALVVESNARIEQLLSSSLARMGYSLESVKTVKEALAKIDANNYELIATSPAVSGAASILARINARKFEERRRTFVVLVSTELETSGPENAFIHGANLTVNTRDLKDLQQLILRGHQEFQKLSG